MRWKKYLQNILTVTFIGVFCLVFALGILRYKKQRVANSVKPVAVSNSVANTTTNTSNTTSNITTNTTSNTTTNTVSNATASNTPKNTTTTPTKPTTASYDGTVYETPFGPVGVTITVSNKKIVNVSTPTYPDSPPSQYAHDDLVSQALSANSANIQGVSGATYTSLAFSKSLESAISKAGTAL